jgi:hypothetical protein
MIKLREFYEYQSKLLNATESFLGYDPLISKPMALPEFTRPGEGKCEYEVEVGDEVFRVVLASGLFFGPIRGYKKVEVYLGEELIINYETRGHGHGSNYSTGHNFHIKGETAYMFVEGNALRDFKADRIFRDLDGYSYYLLVFGGIVIPKNYPVHSIEYSGSNDFPHREELEPHRQKMWEGDIEIPPGTLKVVKSAVPGYHMKSSKGSDTVYQKHKTSTSLDLVELFIGKERYVFEN